MAPTQKKSGLKHILRSLLVACAAATVSTAAPYSWQEPHAGITPSGDLVWQPKPFAYEASDTVRYIDYEGGNDSNAGTMAAPWKHHPWDAEATGNAAAFSGPATYVFKRGVAYRGTLTPDDTGAVGNPIRLTSDPGWGSGEAMLYASEVITSGWERGGHPLMPNSNMVWHIDLPFAPRRVWLVEGASIQRLALARTPNWAESDPDDVKSEWPRWQSVNNVTWGGQSMKRCTSSSLTQSADYYSNALVWIEWFPMMGSPYPCRVRAFDASADAMYFQVVNDWGPSWNTRFFVEDMPQYLDVTNEFWFDKTGNGGRLYVRLSGDREPNGLQIEAARHMNHINSPSISYFDVNGLTFRFNNAFWDLTAQQSLPAQDVDNAAVRVTGGGTDISVRNCVFEHVPEAVRVLSDRVYNILSGVSITDNAIAETDHGAMTIEEYGGTPPYGAVRDLKVLRNRLYRIGMRPRPREHGHAVSILFPETAEIAGNILDRVWASGLFIFGGKASGNIGREVPLTRILIHHNRIVDPLLSCNDWGGIETWQGGPFYLYSNISGNPGGLMRGTSRFGFAYYLDGSYKNYVFNNIAWGKNNTLSSPLCNLAAFQSVLGFQNMFINNSAYKFAIGIRRNTEQTGRNAYVGNIWTDMSDWNYYYDRNNGGHVSDSTYDYRNMAFANNVFHMLAPKVAVFESANTTYTTFEAFRNALIARKTCASSLGQISTNMPFVNAGAHDFRLADGSPAINAGVNQLVPWALYRMLGEWHFRCDNVNPSYVQDENWFMTGAYTNRDNYYQTPRLHLTIANASEGAYVQGPLENWCHSALQFNGSTRYASVPTPASGLTLDPRTNGLIVEVYFKTVPDHTGGVIVSKLDAWNGYALEINEDGTPAMRIRVNGQDGIKTGSTLVNDGAWHHLIGELDRKYGMISLYLDGAKIDMAFSGSSPQPGLWITNRADFLVGKGSSGRYFNGAIDYLRVAGGSFAEARTTINELYEWQFNGPATRDFTGAAPVGQRDAGAFEWGIQPNRAPRVTMQPQSLLVFENGAASFNVFADAAEAYQWRKGGAAIPNATNARYSISAAQSTHVGTYDVVVSSPYGTAVSDTAGLTIVPEPAMMTGALALLLLARGLRRRE